MRALVTGAGGFIGEHLLAALLDAGVQVRAFGSEPPRTSDVDFVGGDVLDPAALRRAMQGCDAVFHLAALYSYNRRDARQMRAVNVDGTRNVLDAALRGPRRRIVHTSTCATCGPVRGRAATEHDCPTRRDLEIPYKWTKLEGERLVLEAAREGADVVIVNPTVPVGPGDRRPTPTGKMVADVAHGRARGYLADSVLNIVAVEDVAVGHLDAFERGRPGQRYLLGGENMTIQEVFAIIARTAGLPPPRLPVPWVLAYGAARMASGLLRPFGREPELLLLDEVRSGRVPHAFDDSKARTELGYVSRPAPEALIEATRSALGPSSTRTAAAV